MDQRGIAVACLTNDVSEWSALLRRRFELETRIRPWIVSGDVGARKPDPQIFAVLQRALDVPLRARPDSCGCRGDGAEQRPDRRTGHDIAGIVMAEVHAR